jgi:hypothetical protein
MSLSMEMNQSSPRKWLSPKLRQKTQDEKMNLGSLTVPGSAVMLHDDGATSKGLSGAMFLKGLPLAKSGTTGASEQIMTEMDYKIGTHELPLI